MVQVEVLLEAIEAGGHCRRPSYFDREYQIALVTCVSERMV